MDAQLQQLLEEQRPHLALEASGKVACTLNGHTMPARYDVVSAFVRWGGAVRACQSEMLAPQPPAACMGRDVQPLLNMVVPCRRGAKYQKLRARALADDTLKKYDPFIVQSNNFT